MDTTLTVQEQLASPRGIAAVAAWVKSFPEAVQRTLGVSVRSSQGVGWWAAA